MAQIKSHLTEDRLNCFQFTPNLHRNVDAIILILILTDKKKKNNKKKNQTQNM